jgi:transposase
MRKHYDGLYALVVSEMKADPLSGDLFLFTNRRRTRAKVLLWDGTGLCLYQKRLERGRFAPLWRRSDEEGVEMTLSELALFSRAVHSSVPYDSPRRRPRRKFSLRSSTRHRLAEPGDGDGH